MPNCTGWGGARGGGGLNKIMKCPVGGRSLIAKIFENLEEVFLGRSLILIKRPRR